MRNFIKIIACFILFSSLTSCGGFKKVDTRKVPISGPERAKQNVKEGRGVGLGNAIRGARGSTNYEFSTSNPMWRATLDVLDFLPLSTVDYSGGVIISDWYTDNSNKNQALKITVRFLSNTIQTNSIKVTVHSKKCSVNQTCNVEIFKSRIQEELVASILREATILERQLKK
ncbi:MAG: hypothetical protein CMI78_02730 [Candidatus Pelagibacter sp.]|nr:hypothetical protein [Candidatus Pelagibacter sp.]OUW67388.1 MAG: hypothetical protein CBD62_03730 [Candidatus Pelagibacter sp. TMED202]|tara:strand:+ start:3085 stop:3600 length:516 start_codon:yes stop_codon:yes gene_type:complete